MMAWIGFGAVALMLIVSAFRVVTSQNLVHCALWLGVMLSGTAAALPARKKRKTTTIIEYSCSAFIPILPPEQWIYIREMRLWQSTVLKLKA